MGFASDETTMLPSVSIVPRMLIVEHDLVAGASLQGEMERAGFDVARVTGGEEAIPSLESRFSQVVILDLDIANPNGLALCRAIREARFPSYVYIIARSVAEDEGAIIRGFEAGADEYISKDASAALLRARLKTTQRILSLEHALKHMLSERRKMSFTDSLTGAYNRRYFTKYAQRELLKAQQEVRPVSLLTMDIDHFKSINDRHGHETGDRVLVEFVRRTAMLLRRGEWCARIGGEEFAVLLPSSDITRAQRVAERIRRAISGKPFEFGSLTIRVTASLGAAGYVTATIPAGATLETLMRRADQCLYQSKALGRNRVTASSMDPSP